MNRFIIRSMTVQPDGTAIEYLDATAEVWPSGLQLQHVIFIPRGHDYEDELDAIELAAQTALLDALQDTATTKAVDLTALELLDPDEIPDDEDEE